MLLVLLFVAALIQYLYSFDRAALISYPNLIDDSQIVRYLGSDGFSIGTIISSVLDEYEIRVLIADGAANRFRPG